MMLIFTRGRIGNAERIASFNVTIAVVPRVGDEVALEALEDAWFVRSVQWVVTSGGISVFVHLGPTPPRRGRR